MHAMPLLAVALALPLAAAAADAGAEFVLRGDARGESSLGPLAEARALVPGIAPPSPSALTLQAEAWATLRASRALSLTTRARLSHEEASAANADRAQLLEAWTALDGGDLQLSLGRKVLGWDVGWGWRPNDVVQQEPRRTLLAQSPQGRAVVQLEGFGRDSAWALVGVNLQRWARAADEQRGADEAAIAARGWSRWGALDLHGFARHGRHTGASLGGAAAWVAGDELALHASARVYERHDRLVFDGLLDRPSASRPWHIEQRGAGAQWLVGAHYTHASGISLLVEAWRDGQARSDNEWRDWLVRNRALSALAADPRWRSAAAGNLAWQAEPLVAVNLRRDNALARLAWQSGDWNVSLDTLFTPADRGRVVTAALQFKGGQWRFDLAWRHLGGPDAALFSQLPLRRSLLAAATLAI